MATLNMRLSFSKTMTGNTKHTESELISLVKSGDKSVMRLLYDAYVGYLSAVCGRYVADENDKKDILQETFIKIFTSLDRFEYRGKGSLRAWMVRITVNETIKFLKQASALSIISHEERLPDMPDEPDVEDVPDDVINSMILALPPGYRMVFNLYVFGNKSHKEIAKMLNIGESTSASQFSRAKALLTKRIKEYKQTHQND